MPHNKRGHEVPDPTPVALATNLKKPESMEDMIRRYVRIEGSKVAQANEMETFEEANDFEPEPDDEDRLDTIYTVPDMIPEAGPEGEIEGLDGTPTPLGEINSPQEAGGSEGGTPSEPPVVTTEKTSAEENGA